jgi:hypothetical protein
MTARLKRWGAWALAVLCAALGAGWLWSRRGQLAWKARARVAEIAKGVAADKAMRDALISEATSETAEIERLSRRIEERERAIVAHHERVEGLSREEIRERLSRLGY